MEIKTDVTVELDSLQDVNDLLTDLKEAKRLAKRSGGEHYVYRTDPKTGNKAVFKLHFRWAECMK